MSDPFAPSGTPAPGPERRLTTVERAFELAQSGICRTIDEIAAQLKIERHEAVDAHLHGTSMRRDLRQLCAQSRTLRMRSPPAPAAPADPAV